MNRDRWRLPPGLLEDFIAVGQHGPSATRLQRVAEHDEANRLHWSTWERLTAEMTADKLFALLRGVVIAERELGWGGGSVSAGIWLARSLVKRFPETWVSAAGWLKANGQHNHYLFSQSYPHAHLGPEAWKAYLAREHERWQQQKNREIEAAARRRVRMQESKERMTAVRARQATESQKRYKALEGLELLSPVERIRHLLGVKVVSLAWFPTHWGVLSSTELSSLQTTEVVSLLKLASTRAGKPWRQHRALLRRELARRAG